jgi:hypothetical protein
MPHREVILLVGMLYIAVLCPYLKTCHTTYKGPLATVNVADWVPWGVERQPKTASKTSGFGSLSTGTATQVDI